MEIKIETSEIISHLENVSKTDQTPFNKEHYFIIRSFLESQKIWVCNSSTLCQECGYPTGYEEHPAICLDCANISSMEDEKPFLNEEERKELEEWNSSHCMSCGEAGHHDSRCPHSGILNSQCGCDLGMDPNTECPTCS
jgi:hypothetical protein